MKRSVHNKYRWYSYGMSILVVYRRMRDREQL